MTVRSVSVLAMLLGLMAATPAMAADNAGATNQNQHVQIQRISPQDQTATPQGQAEPIAGPQVFDQQLMNMQNQMNRMFQSFFDQGPMGMPMPGQMPDMMGGNDMMSMNTGFPRVDILNNKKDYEVDIELPGINPDSVDLSITNHFLTIKGEKEQKQDTENKNYVMHESSFGSFERAIGLPAAADVDHADASYSNGVLKVTFPKTAGAEPQTRKLTIRKSSS